jgi:short-subunit dehydrogenase
MRDPRANGHERRPTALITGASSGIGYEFARLFARERYDLVLVARHRGALERVAEECRGAHGVAAELIVADLSVPDSARAIFEVLERSGTEVDVLVNNAGFGLYGPFAATDPAANVALLQVNVVALTQLTRLFLGGMIARRRGKILNVASVAAFQPGPLMSVYYASKAYVVSFTAAVASEVRDYGVTVSALCPGATWTDFHKRARMRPSRLFSLMAMDAAAVARVGYDGLMRGKTLIVPGFANKLIVATAPLLPLRFVTGAVKRIQAGREEA